MTAVDLFAYADDRARAERLRDAGIARASKSADGAVPGWHDVAFNFLADFCRAHQSFISEDVSAASKLTNFPQPATDRSWGAIYKRACREGLIVQDGSGRSNRRHRSICPRWRSLVYQGGES